MANMFYRDIRSKVSRLSSSIYMETLRLGHIRETLALQHFSTFCISSL